MPDEPEWEETDEDDVAPAEHDQYAYVNDKGVVVMTRDVDRVKWLEWRNGVWSSSLDALGTALVGLAAELPKLDYDSDGAISSIIENICANLAQAGQFYSREAWTSCIEQGRDLIAGLSAGAAAPELAEELQRFLADPGATTS